MSISVDIRKKLSSFSLNVKFDASDETLALLGASGCGKSMTLKCIAGIETPDEGRIVVDGITFFDSENHVNLSPQERHVGLMFQNYALFPNMTVLQNIRTGAKREKNKSKRESIVRQTMENFGIVPLAAYYPNQLSGGQQQRVALARILVSNPRILLLDEPFSALDTHLRFRMEQEVRSVIQSFKRTVLLVSHDRDEVYRMADSIAVMNKGKIDVCDETKKVFANPRTKAGAMLTGCKNISPFKRIGQKKIFASDWGLEILVNEIPVGAEYVGIRMHDVRPEKGDNAALFKVVEVIENPFSVTIMLRPCGRENTIPIGWETDKETWKNHRADEVYLRFPPEALLLLKENDDD